MNRLLGDFFIIVLCLILGFIVSKMVLTNIRGLDYNSRTYNCDLAEISPDFPKEVRQKCRELRQSP